MKTLQECKEEIAKEFGYQSWDALRFSHSMTYGKADVYADKAAELYKEQYRKLAKDAAFELGNANIQILKLEENIEYIKRDFQTMCRGYREVKDELEKVTNSKK